MVCGTRIDGDGGRGRQLGGLKITQAIESFAGIAYSGVVGDLLRFDTANGSVLVEERAGADLERVGLLDRIRPAKERLEDAFAQIRPAVEAAVQAISGLKIAP